LAQLAAAGAVVEISDHQFCGFTDILDLLNQEIFTLKMVSWDQYLIQSREGYPVYKFE
jgi:hypothetical protein